MASLVTADEDVVILKAGWIFRQKPLLKKWRKCWAVVSLGGNLKFYANKRSSSTQKVFNVKQDMLVFKCGTQCRTLLPPVEVEVGCLMELHFTGGRRVSLCAHDIESASLWLQAITKAQSEKALPTPRYVRKNRTKEDALKEESEEQNNRQQKLWYRFLCCGGANQVETFTTPRQPGNARRANTWT